jgi:hypothetical protein
VGKQGAAVRRQGPAVQVAVLSASAERETDSTL